MRTYNDSLKSNQHQTSIHSAREKRISVAEDKKIKENKKIQIEINEHSINQRLHYVRADSARSERVDSLNKRNKDWEKSC